MTIELFGLHRNDWERVAADPEAFANEVLRDWAVASAMAAGLVERARSAVGVRRLRAYTLPEKNASTRVLEKIGFRWLGDAIHPEDGPVWRWERDPFSNTSEIPSG
jgi:hypothetical protein